MYQRWMGWYKRVQAATGNNDDEGRQEQRANHLPGRDEFGTSGAEDSDEDLITDYLEPCDGGTGHTVSMAQRLGGPGPLVPTISVTTHSPGGKHYPVLEDNLLQLHEIHESIQQMRDQSAAQAFSSQILGLTQYARLSASCPSLNEPGSDPDGLGSANSSPTHGAPLGSFVSPGLADILCGKGNSKEWLMCRRLDGDNSRRRSWTALEDLTNGGDKRKATRQRSMSLSSLDSEPDDPFVDQVDSAGSTSLLVLEPAGAAAAGGRRATRSAGGASTHSLNEADLQSDFQKIVAKREAERLLPARLPLQKSVSTPSIVATHIGVDAANGRAAQLIPVSINCQRPSGTESETEEEVLAAVKSLVPANMQITLDEFLTNTEYDHAGKRRKRGSIFFRKKKDKVKKATHQWVSACYGSAHACDWCSKPLTNKPALYCENCTTTVHQNSCKDHILDCNKPKIIKNVSKGALPVSAVNSKSSMKRGASSASGHNAAANSNRRMGCHHVSPWRRVANKLGVNQIINEEKENDGSHHEGVNFSDDVPLVQFEFLDETPVTAYDFDIDPSLGLQDEEPDSWTPTVGKEITKKLKEKEIKRQEHIYEFILTEKHHCLTLLVMQKVFVEGFQKHFQLGKDLDRMFPRLLDLTDIHLNFLQRLRQRQRLAPIVETISDILLEQFSGLGASKLKTYYGEFCSRHRDAVDIYKNYLHERRFAEFVRHCQTNPLLKKKGIPECILFVTQRLTKYPLLIEPLIKTAKENKVEQEKLSKGLALVKEILVEVDAQVAEKEKEDRKLEIYNKIEAKSFTVHVGNKFKKSDILSKNRRLKFEGVATLMQGRSKMQLVLVIALSDVLFFLLENNQKYSFFTPDNKAGVVSLQKLLVREKAGQDSRGIYLISSNPADPEMFELKVHKPKDKQVWIRAIRAAVQSCQEDEDDGVNLSGEERQKRLEAKQSLIRQIVGVLRQKDVEQAQILEEKMALQQKLLAAAGVDNVLEPPHYCNLVAEDIDSSAIWQEVICAVQEVNQLASSLYASGSNLSRSVSSVGERQSDAYISPTLPKRAETFGGFDNANPAQAGKGAIKKHPKDSHESSTASSSIPEDHGMVGKLPLDQMPWRNAMLATIPPGVLAANLCNNACQPPAVFTTGHEQQLAAVQLTHYVYKLISIISQQMTSIQSLQAQFSACKSQLTEEDGRGGSSGRPIYRHNQQLEELRNLQDRLSHEKEAWQREKDNEERDIDEKKAQLKALQDQVRADQHDIAQQREQLFRKMELLSSQGLLISPNMPVVSQSSHEDATGSVSGDEPPSDPSTPPTRKMDPKWKSSNVSKSSLPINLISATNQQKVPPSMQVKQQLPLKLAGKLGAGAAPPGVVSPVAGPGVQQMLPLKLSQMATESGRRTSQPGSGYKRLGSGSFSPPGPGVGHSRTGSSPASMQNLGSAVPVGNKAGRTHTYPKLPERFRVTSPDAGQNPGQVPAQSGPTGEEEIIFF